MRSAHVGRVVVWALAVALLVRPAFADEPPRPDVDALLAKLDDLYRSKSSIARVEIVVVTPRSTRTMRVKAWTSGEDKALLVVESPSRDAGTATLRVDNNLIENQVPVVGYGYSGNGIMLYHPLPVDPLITNNQILNNNEAIRLEGSGGLNLPMASIHDNTVSGNACARNSTGISASNSALNTFADNVLSHHTWPLYCQDTTDTIAGNTIAGGGNSRLDGAVAVMVRDNDISEKDVVLYVGPRSHFVQYPLRGGAMFNQVAVFE
jgi:hypothetical protein